VGKDSSVGKEHLFHTTKINRERWTHRIFLSITDVHENFTEHYHMVAYILQHNLKEKLIF
jgi:hypothetical protein